MYYIFIKCAQLIRLISTCFLYSTHVNRCIIVPGFTTNIRFVTSSWCFHNAYINSILLCNFALFLTSVSYHNKEWRAHSLHGNDLIIVDIVVHNIPNSLFVTLGVCIDSTKLCNTYHNLFPFFLILLEHALFLCIKHETQKSSGCFL